MVPPDIFDRNARRLRRDRAARGGRADFLRQAMLEGLGERIASVRRNFAEVLDLGCADGTLAVSGATMTRGDAGAVYAAAAGGIQAEEDNLPFPPESFDLVVSAGVLDSVNDVPGALLLARRVLRPDGLFLAAFVGAGSLSTLRRVFRDAEPDRAVARFHPQIDVRAAGDLLVRAGFTLPVADVETLTVRYGALSTLLEDLRSAAATNLMPRRQPLRRDTLARADALFQDRADADGRTSERFEIDDLTGWAPAPGQPQPARRGSATASLAEALQRRE